MTAKPGSPNFCWEKAGYEVKRIPIRDFFTNKREIYSPDGELVMIGGDYYEELDMIKKLGIYREY